MRPLILAALLAVPAAAYDSIEFRDSLKTDGLQRPVAVAASASTIYVLNKDPGGLALFDSAGKMTAAEAKFDRPKGLALGPDGRVFVADAGGSLIQILDARGKFLSSFGNRGSEPGKLKNPEGIAVGADGRVYVDDTGNNRVEVFTVDGILLAVIGSAGKGAGQFKSPTKLAVDPSGYVYVLDSGNGRVEKFDPSARFVREMPARGDDFAVDDYGFIYAIDADAGKVYEEDSAGNVLGPFGSKGKGAGQYKRLTSVAVAPDGSLVVLDAGNGRVDRVVLTNKLKLAPLPPDLATKITASGPSKKWPVAASAVEPVGDELYALLPKEGALAVIGADGKEKRRFDAPKDAGGFSVGKKHVFVSDASGNKIERRSPDGKLETTIAESTGFFDSKKKEGRVRDPRGIVVNEQGSVYVADAGNARVDAFNPEGMFLFGIGPKLGDYELKQPVALAWDQASFVYFVDKSLKKIFKCQPSGALVAAWGEEGEGPGQFEEPASIALDGKGYVYVLDAKLRRVSVFTQDGKWMTDLFSGGLGDNELDSPAAVAVSGSRLLVSDPGKGRVVAFDLHPALAAPVIVSTGSKEGIVSLEWKEVAEPWTARYRVYRASQPFGPFVEAGATAQTRFEDSSVAAYQKYYYRVATEARTKDVGAPSSSVEVAVAGAFNRAPIEISTMTIGNVFSANYKWYLKNPIGKAVVANNVNLPFEKVKVSFRLKDFMDFGYDTEIQKLEPQQSVEVPLIATLNNKILEVSEDTPVQAELSLTYFESGSKQTVSLTQPLRVYSRNAITWDDPERIVNFITPKDPPLLEYAREVLREAPQNAKAKALNPNVATALQLWDAVSESGVKFFTNPGNPYEKLSEDPSFPVDYTQFPRETLKRKSGQCDDLTTLFVSMLDSTKVRAAILDFPGHMALLFDTEADDPADAGLPEDMLVQYDGTYWVPVEATLVGHPFPEAVRKAAYAYKTESAKGKARVIDVRGAWERFEPATLPPKDWDAEVPSAAARQKRFDEESGELFSARDKFLRGLYAARLKENAADVDARVELGLLDVDAGDRAAAAKQFGQAAAADPKSAAALNNLGALAFLNGDFAGAEADYLKAADAEAGDPDIWMNLVKTAVQLKDKDKAAKYGAKATSLDARLSPAVETLTKGL